MGTSSVREHPNKIVGLWRNWKQINNKRWHPSQSTSNMMTSSNWNIFRVTCPLYEEFTGHRWIPLTKARDAEHGYLFLIYAWIHRWVNNREAGDLRRHHAYSDVIVINDDSALFHIVSNPNCNSYCLLGTVLAVDMFFIIVHQSLTTSMLIS